VLGLRLMVTTRPAAVIVTVRVVSRVSVRVTERTLLEAGRPGRRCARTIATLVTVPGGALTVSVRTVVRTVVRTAKARVVAPAAERPPAATNPPAAVRRHTSKSTMNLLVVEALSSHHQRQNPGL
jgi:hypothetical protein